MSSYIEKFIIASLIIFPAASSSASLIGKWCPHGEPYTCYPPVQHDSDIYICTDSTTVVTASEETLDWVTNETHHYYTDGLTTGKTKAKQVRIIFSRDTDSQQLVYKSTYYTGDVTKLHRLTVKGNQLILEFIQTPDDSDAPHLKQQTAFARCDNEKTKHSFYTALIDCGGSGDYIAGVPSVVDNPLLWSQWKSDYKNNKCRVAARCWGGGWVAFAYSKDKDEKNTAFGAACGGSSRDDAKQQAINTCKQSGGNNCLYQVLSGYDDGTVDGIDGTNKGSKLESCYFGKCEKMSD